MCVTVLAAVCVCVSVLVAMFSCLSDYVCGYVFHLISL